MPDSKTPPITIRTVAFRMGNPITRSHRAQSNSWWSTRSVRRFCRIASSCTSHSLQSIPIFSWSPFLRVGGHGSEFSRHSRIRRSGLLRYDIYRCVNIAQFLFFLILFIYLFTFLESFVTIWSAHWSRLSRFNSFWSRTNRLHRVSWLLSLRNRCETASRRALRLWACHSGVRRRLLRWPLIELLLQHRLPSPSRARTASFSATSSLLPTAISFSWWGWRSRSRGRLTRTSWSSSMWSTHCAGNTQ